MSRSKKKSSEFLSSLGVMFEIWKKITDEVISVGGNDEDLRRLLSNNPPIANVVAYHIVRQRFLQDGFPVKINWQMPVSQYEYFYDRLGSECDPQDTTMHLEQELAVGSPNGMRHSQSLVRLLHINYKIEVASVEELQSIMDCRGVRPATPLEAASFGGLYPMEQRFYPICTLIQPFKMGSLLGYVPCLFLYCDKGKRIFEYYTANPWGEDIRFLVASKKYI